MIYALWHGGAGYSPGYVTDTGTGSDVEVFDDMDALTDALEQRYRMGHHWPQTFTYADGRRSSVLTPCVGADSNFWVWHYDPREEPDPYPDLIAELVLDDNWEHVATAVTPA